MKELSIEGKATRYDKVVNKLRRFMEQGIDPLITRADVQDFFPELRGSEDERVRNGLIEVFKSIKSPIWFGLNIVDIIAWLEKQAAHAKFINSIQVGDKVTSNEDGVLVNLSQLNRVANKDEKQSGRFVRWEKNTADNKPALNHSVLMKNTQGVAEGEWNGKEWIQYRWSCKVKDSDVLYWMDLPEFEKQCEHKPVDKVEPQFEVGDVIRLKGSAAEYTIKRVTDTTYYTDGWSCGIERCEEDYELVEKKPSAWSDEDEAVINKAESWLDTLCDYLKDSSSECIPDIKDVINKLKSLRPRNRWKPSEEQMNTLEYYMHTLVCNEHKEILFGLYSDLKKLREE